MKITASILALAIGLSSAPAFAGGRSTVVAANANVLAIVNLAPVKAIVDVKATALIKTNLLGILGGGGYGHGGCGC